jgi:magnesium chelatase family protein
MVPLRQAGEARLVAGIDVIGLASITQLVAFLRGEPMPLVDPIEVMGDPAGKHAKRRLDLADVVGQAEAVSLRSGCSRSAPHALPRPAGRRQDHAR